MNQNSKQSVELEKEKEKEKENLDKERKKGYTIGKNWNGNNISTLLSWIAIASYNIQCLELSIKYCRDIIRRNIILGLILSTASGTISITRFSPMGSTSSPINIFLNTLFTIMSFTIAINTGRIKIYQYQERLEQFIKIKQEWIYFVTIISTELQLPIDLRQDALYLIANYKVKFLDLLKTDNEIPDYIKNAMETKIALDMKKYKRQNKQVYNVHGSLILNRGIKISDIISDIAHLEGLHLIKSEYDPAYHANKDINKIYESINIHRLSHDVLNKINNNNDTCQDNEDDNCFFCSYCFECFHFFCWCKNKSNKKNAIEPELDSDSENNSEPMENGPNLGYCPSPNEFWTNRLTHSLQGNWETNSEPMMSQKCTNNLNSLTYSNYSNYLNTNEAEAIDDDLNNEAINHNKIKLNISEPKEIKKRKEVTGGKQLEEIDLEYYESDFDSDTDNSDII
jgi:hypothetical protein